MQTLALSRVSKNPDGVFSILTLPDGTKYHCLEHAYSDGGQAWLPKIPNGSFTCVRGERKLTSMIHTFSTFEVTGVAGHSNLLFHQGNYDRDSEGCILVGLSFDSDLHPMMVTASRVAFADFMSRLKDVDQFTLNVVG